MRVARKRGVEKQSKWLTTPTSHYHVLFFQEAKKRAKEKAEAQKQVEAILAAAAGDGDGKSNAEGGGGAEASEAAAVDPAKRAKALSKKIKKLETVKAKKDAGESINAVGWVGAVVLAWSAKRVADRSSVRVFVVFFKQKH